MIILFLVTSAICFNPFKSITEYFLHDEINNLNDFQLKQEIKFYREIEKNSVWHSLTSASIGMTLGIPCILGGLGTLPLSLPLIVGTYSVTQGMVYFLSREKKNELRYRNSKDYKLWKAHLSDFVKQNEKLNNQARKAFQIFFSISAIYFAYLILDPNKNNILGLVWHIILFISICFVQSFLVTKYIEYKKTITRRENLIQKFGGECNWYNLPPQQKVFRYLTTTYDKETGWILNDDNCNMYKEQANEISITDFGVLTLMGLKPIIRNIKLLYYEFTFLEKIFTLNLFFVILIACILVLKYYPRRQSRIVEKVAEYYQQGISKGGEILNRALRVREVVQ